MSFVAPWRSFVALIAATPSSCPSPSDGSLFRWFRPLEVRRLEEVVVVAMELEHENAKQEKKTVSSSKMMENNGK